MVAPGPVLGFQFYPTSSSSLGGDSGKRGDLVEIMQTSNFTEAFEKPKKTTTTTGQRNLVGYGWKHFVPLNTIFENGFYGGRSKDMIAIMADIKHLPE